MAEAKRFTVREGRLALHKITWEATAETFGKLTLAVSQLQFTLSREFYPDQPG